MKKLLLTLLLFICSKNQIIAQKQRLEGDTSKYLCKNDSLANDLLNRLKFHGVDSIISILYDYDNGRIEKTTQIILWSHNNHDSLRFIQGCDGKIRDSVLCLSLDHLWKSTMPLSLIDFNKRISNAGYQSHDCGYSVELFLPACKESFSIRNYQRRNHLEMNKAPDTRVVFLNRLDIIISTLFPGFKE